MPTRPLSPAEMVAAVSLVAQAIAEGHTYGEEHTKKGESAIRRAADMSQWDDRQIHHRVVKAKERLGITPETFGAFKTPVDTDDIPDPEALIKRLSVENKEYIQASRRKLHRVIPVPAEPFGTAFVGDPHMGNRGCNLEALKKDIELIRAAKLHGVMMGDMNDNFQRRAKLADKEAENAVTATECRALERWLIRDSGVSWAALLLGNHDKWLNETTGLFGAWASQAQARFYDWLVTLTFAWEGGEFSVFAAHDLTGHSQFNATHAHVKKELKDGRHDLVVLAHRHTAASSVEENGFRGRVYNRVRVRGYKDYDGYAVTRGYDEQSEGRSAVAVIDPQSQTMHGRCRIFFDVAEGVEYLQHLRSRK